MRWPGQAAKFERPEIGAQEPSAPNTRGLSHIRGAGRAMRRRLHKSELSGLFAGLSKELEKKSVQVQVAPLRLGDRIEAEWLTLLGLSYDPRSDTLFVVLDGVDVTIPRPREIHIDETGGQLE